MKKLINLLESTGYLLMITFLSAIGQWKVATIFVFFVAGLRLGEIVLEGRKQ
ncbi:MAG TPA: hypothetical protein K8V88_06610 [Companilactobacillus farciminis]|uniref:Uncharacterized protein n=1 Tax=Companilactobacillus farciminis TaxID=1612 RepID=A0A921HSI5_9LACO|nr:hypothetical protein [Companilactobacillus farciminis]